MPEAQPGAPLRPSAREWNRFRRAADRVEQLPQFAPGSFSPASGFVRVRNYSGGEVERFGVLGINTPITGADTAIQVSRADNADAFDALQICFRGREPDASAGGSHHQAFVITQERINNSGPIRHGLAIISGLTAVQVDLVATWHEFATITDGDTSQLTSVPGGAAQILHLEDPSTTGVQWAIVRLGQPPLIRARCTADSAFTTLSSSVSVTLANCSHRNYESRSVTANNLPRGGGNYEFQGDSGDYGECWYNVEHDAWYLSYFEAGPSAPH